MRGLRGLPTRSADEQLASGDKLKSRDVLEATPRDRWRWPIQHAMRVEFRGHSKRAHEQADIALRRMRQGLRFRRATMIPRASLPRASATRLKAPYVPADRISSLGLWCASGQASTSKCRPTSSNSRALKDQRSDTLPCTLLELCLGALGTRSGFARLTPGRVRRCCTSSQS